MSKKVIVYGGRGALGQTCIKNFMTAKWWVANIDYKTNSIASTNIIPRGDDWVEQEKEVMKNINLELKGSKLDAIVCVAGGFKAGNAAKDLSKKADKMWKQSVWTSTIAASIAAKHLNAGGILVLTGAKTALGGTPGTIGYGMAKAAIHQLTQSLACENSGLPEKSLTVAILPETLDTEENRKLMPKADFSRWTPMDYVAKLIQGWIVGEDRPKNGSLITLETTNRITTPNRFQAEPVKSVCE